MGSKKSYLPPWFLTRPYHLMKKGLKTGKANNFLQICPNCWLNLKLELLQRIRFQKVSENKSLGQLLTILKNLPLKVFHLHPRNLQITESSCVKKFCTKIAWRVFLTPLTSRPSVKIHIDTVIRSIYLWFYSFPTISHVIIRPSARLTIIKFKIKSWTLIKN